MKKLPVVTLDGPAGVGKTTLARRTAEALGYPYLDTGAMFRIVALRLGEGADVAPESELRARCMEFSFRLEGVGSRTVLLCNDEPVGEEIRTEEVARLASRLAAVPVVREYLKQAQRILGEAGPLVAEGRDMGTAVFPNARYKFFLDASPEVRALRRVRELEAAGEKADPEVVADMIRKRDERDRNRAVAPLRPAEDAVVIDTSFLDADAVLERVLEAVRAPEPEFTHLTPDGGVTMVDVGGKAATERRAVVRAVVEMSARTLELLRNRALPKGDALTTAKLAGIMAAKRTAELVPLCHPVPLTFVDVRFAVRDAPPCVEVEAEARTCDRTGVEMEALVAAQIAAAALYDMCKAVQRDIVIRDARLIRKSGGRSGDFEAGECGMLQSAAAPSADRLC